MRDFDAKRTNRLCCFVMLIRLSQWWRTWMTISWQLELWQANCYNGLLNAVTGGLTVRPPGMIACYGFCFVTDSLTPDHRCHAWVTKIRRGRKLRLSNGEDYDCSEFKILPINFPKLGFFSPKFCTDVQKFSCNKKIFWQFSNCPIFFGGEGNCLPSS